MKISVCVSENEWWNVEVSLKFCVYLWYHLGCVADHFIRATWLLAVLVSYGRNNAPLAHNIRVCCAVLHGCHFHFTLLRCWS